MLKMHQLVQFVTIAGSGSLREAAEKLYISEPALSRNLRKLEAGLGCELFERTSTGLVLNDFGEAALVRANRILQEADALQAEIDEMRGQEPRCVRLASDHGDFCVCAADFFARRYGDIRFQAICVAGADELESMARSRACDIAIFKGAGAEGRLASLGALKIYDEQVFLSAPASWVTGPLESVTLERLAGLRFTLPRDRGRGVDGWCERLVEAAGIPSESIEYVDIDRFMRDFNDLESFSMVTSTLLTFIMHDHRTIIPIDSATAHDSLNMVECSTSPLTGEIAGLLARVCGKGSGMNSFLAYVSTRELPVNVEVIDRR